MMFPANIWIKNRGLLIPLTCAFRASYHRQPEYRSHPLSQRIHFQEAFFLKRTSKRAPGLLIATLLLTAMASAQLQMPKPAAALTNLAYYTRICACAGNTK